MIHKLDPDLFLQVFQCLHGYGCFSYGGCGCGCGRVDCLERHARRVTKAALTLTAKSVACLLSAAATREWLQSTRAILGLRSDAGLRSEDSKPDE